MQVNYQIDIANPNSHYANVTIQILNNTEKSIAVKMPVWTPGSYMVREFERNVDKVKASNGNDALEISKSDKNTWMIKDTKGANAITITYPVYCFEAGVRTSYIDGDRAFFILTSCLMYVHHFENSKGQLELKYSEYWKIVSTTLTALAPNKYSYNNYDELVDSPIEIGNHEEIKFTVNGVPHRAALIGLNNCPKEKFTTDIQKICETMTAIVGEHPCKEYLFFIQHVEEGGGGLEHANSCVVQMPRFNYTKPDRYTAFMGLLAHEYFHLWNVKRIRPAALGPFDYSKENHTNLLWVAEGITSYYDELALYRAGFHTKEQYLEALSGEFSATQNRQGSAVQCLHEASFDTWIKEYRPNENSINSNISYYTKGAVVAALLDIQIIKATNGAKHLDDLMQYLYKEFYIKQGRGFTDAEFYAAINTVAGSTIDMKEWVLQPNDATTYDKWKQVFAAVECDLESKSSDALTYTGINTEIKGERLLIKSVEANSPSVTAGLQAGDELIAIKDLRLKTNWDEVMKNVALPSFTVTISRAGIVRVIQLKATKSPKVAYKLVEKNKDNSFLSKWLLR